MSKTKNSKKWIIGGSIFSLLIFGLAMGIGVIISITTKSDPDYVNLVINGKTYSSSKIDLGEESTSDETKAKMLQSQFLSASLFGYANMANLEDTSIDYNYILEKESLDWNTPYAVEIKNNTSENIRDAFIETKFLSDTQDKSVFNYLNSLSENATNPIQINLVNEQIKSLAEDAGLNWAEITGMDLINNAAFKNKEIIIDIDDEGNPIKLPLLEAVAEVLLKDYSYQVEVLNDIYVYSYLWQNAAENAYDYKLTKELAYSKPSMTSSATFDLETLENSSGIYPSLDEVKNGKLIMSNSDSWNGIYEGLHGGPSGTYPSILVDDSKYDDLISAKGFRGFDGVTFGTGSGEHIGSDWTDIKNTWLFDKTISVGDTPLTRNGNYTNENITDSANLYISEDGNNGGVITDVIDDPTNPDFGIDTGEASIYAYNQLVPYVFRGVKDEDKPVILDSSTFSLFANNDLDIFTEATMGEDIEYIFERWFPDLTSTIDIDESLFGEIYVIEALINHNSSLKTKAMEFWKEKGFYIELSGSYESSLLNFIPDILIKDK